MPRPPSKGQIVYGFGGRFDPITGVWRQHNGVDIAHNAGYDLVAPERGRLIRYGANGDWGIQAVLLSVDGRREHRLAHTYRLQDGIRVSSSYAEGTNLAVMGDTGRALGIHAHWEVVEDGRYIDPLGWLARTAGSGGEEFEVVTDAEMEKIADLTVKKLLGFKMHGGKKVSGTTTIPTESLGERIRQIRRYSVGNAIRTQGIVKQITGIREQIEVDAGDDLTQTDVAQVVASVIEEAGLAGLSKTEVTEAFRAALEGAHITLSTQSP